MSHFPPTDICGFLELSAGEWLALRSLLGQDADERIVDSPPPNAASTQASESWHQADRGELTMTVVKPTQLADWGGLEIALPDQATLTLIFRRDNTFTINSQSGQWHLGADGSLELEIRDSTRIVKERIWFSKPNLRLRCSLEQFLDGQPGRASFSSEIRRLSRPPA